MDSSHYYSFHLEEGIQFKFLYLEELDQTMDYSTVAVHIIFLHYLVRIRLLLFSLLFQSNDFILSHHVNFCCCFSSFYTFSHKSKEDSSSLAFFDNLTAPLLIQISTTCIHDYISWFIILQAVLPNKVYIFKAVLHKQIGILFKLFHNSREIHRLLYYRGIVKDIQFYIVHRVSKRSTLLVAPDVFQDKCQSYLLFHVQLSLLRHDSNQYKSYILIVKLMRNYIQDSLIQEKQYEYCYNKSINKKGTPNDKGQKYEDRQLYQLCQQLTRENRFLKREVNDLKKRVESNVQNFSVFSEIADQQNYRQLHYECYKKKAVQLLSSVRYLHQLYTEKLYIDKRNTILDEFMGKIRQGKSNTLDQLFKIYSQKIKNTGEEHWDIDLLQRQSSQYQNNLLRRTVVKLNTVLLQSVYNIKNDLNSAKYDIVKYQKKIDEEISNHLSKYSTNDNKSAIVQQSIMPKKTKSKKSTKKCQDQNAFSKMSWKRVADQRSKIQQIRIQPNIKQNIRQSLALLDSHQYNTMPLSAIQYAKPKIPKPQLRGKKQDFSAIEEFHSSKYTTGKSSVTPKSLDKSHTINSIKCSSVKKHNRQGSSSKASKKQSPKRAPSHYR